MPQPNSLEARARELSYTLVGWPSVTGTRDEAEFPHRLAALLGDSPYFRDNPGDLTVQPIPNDPLGRSNVFALVRGKGSRTVILAGHFDVVPVDDYTDLAPLAGLPGDLTTALIARLKATGGYRQALADLESGEFVPGRGMLDMKSGVAAGIAVLEDFSRDPERIGNLLLIATPDEEERSSGMRAAADHLPAFLAERQLDVPLAINLDATCDLEKGRTGRIVTMGTIGKLLVSAFVVGKDSHACYPFDGVNSAYLAAELVTEFECAPELAEVTGAELAAPPTVLSLKDQKTVYNVTTPGRSWLFWNVLIHRRSPQEVIETSRGLAERAVARAQARIRERVAAIGHPIEVTPVWADIRVMTHAEMMEQALRQDGFATVYRDEAERLAAAGDMDLPTRARILTELAWNAAGIDGCAVVIGNASMPYPAVEWQRTAANDRTERQMDVGIAAIREREGVSIDKHAFFPAISDMSFLGASDPAGLEITAANTPLWGSSIRWALDDQSAGVPIVNIGPWGRDYHHWLERTHADYTFRVLPELVRSVALTVLADED